MRDDPNALRHFNRFWQKITAKAHARLPSPKDCYIAGFVEARDMFFANLEEDLTAGREPEKKA